MLIGNNTWNKADEFLESLIGSDCITNGVHYSHWGFRVVSEIVFNFFENLVKGFFHAFQVGDVHKDILPYLNVGLASNEKSLELRDDFLDVAYNERTEEGIQLQGFEGLRFFVNNSLVQDFL